MPQAQSQQPGRHDRRAPLLAPGERLLAAALTAGTVGFGCWHLAVWATVRGLGIGHLDRTLHALLAGHPLSGLGGGIRSGSPIATAVVGVMLLAAVSTVVTVLAVVIDTRWRGRAGKGLADVAAVRRAVSLKAARRTAAYTRPSTYATPDGKPDRRAIATAPLHEIGWLVGTQVRTGAQVVISLDDSVGVLGPTGARKTRTVVTRACLDAPGPLVLTSTRADALDVVAEHAVRRGHLWVFDPLDSIGWPEPMVWDPVAGCQHGQTAMARGDDFIAGVGADDDATTNAAFFRDTGRAAIQTLCHAAALSDAYRGMDAVIEWAINLATADDPRAILRTHPAAEPYWHDLLVSVATGADETVASTRTTLTNKLRPLMLRQVMRCLTPRPGVPQFDPDAFVDSRDTLVLICDDNAPANVSPLTTMLFGEVIEASKRRGRRAPGGRLDPPVRVMGDEICNVSPISNFPALASDTRALGIELWWAMQSLSAAEQRWGPLGARTLWNNTTARLVLGGHADADLLRELSDLLGDVDVTEIQLSYTQLGLTYQQAVQESQAERRILRPGEIRELADGQVLAIIRSAPAILLDLPAWTDRPDARELIAAERRTRARRARHNGENIPAPPANPGPVAGPRTVAP